MWIINLQIDYQGPLQIKTSWFTYPKVTFTPINKWQIQELNPFWLRINSIKIKVFNKITSIIKKSVKIILLMFSFVVVVVVIVCGVLN